MQSMLRIRGFLEAVPDAVVALTFLSAWISPEGGEKRLLGLAALLFIELFALQVPPMAGALALRRQDGSRVIPLPAAAAVVLMVSFVVGTFSVVFAGTLWPLVFFWGLALNRYVHHRAWPASRAFLWGLSLAAFLGVMLFSVLLPQVPPLGLQGVRLSGFSGPWFAEPQRICLAGGLYFGGMSAFRVLAAFIRPPSPLPPDIPS